ncbi:TPA: alcohol dehydrogenase catalytic domain-containing protein [Clostridium botulinum]|nr:alcohol dehydrogenase catalytic domain-containing protein [Clostridium botulinum]HBJ1654298.1 alcohol dehydrogenase catalytic domain-containing protein [Clostridium botulinum]
MINKIYRLTSRKKFEEVFIEEQIKENSIFIRPTYLSVCVADQRYYKFERPIEVLNKKLPMALIHEAIGEVVYDPKGEYKKGDKVILIPCIPVEKDAVIEENYLRSSLFRSSGYDGFLQEIVNQPRERVVKIPNNLYKPVMAFTELMSVSIQAIERFDNIAHSRREHIGVWGDGNVGFITALFLKEKYPESKIHVFGKNSDKLDMFIFADEIHLISDDLNGIKIDHAFECVGGHGSQIAINQIIDIINPQGYISLMGVSEEHVQINTRMTLEKGLLLIGNSRSTIDDYKNTVYIINNNPKLLGYLESIINSVQKVRKINDINKVFEDDNTKIYGKTILKWDI